MLGARGHMRRRREENGGEWVRGEGDMVRGAIEARYASDVMHGVGAAAPKRW